MSLRHIPPYKNNIKAEIYSSSRRTMRQPKNPETQGNFQYNLGQKASIAHHHYGTGSISSGGHRKVKVVRPSYN